MFNTRVFVLSIAWILCVGWVDKLFASDFPSSYIDRQLNEAREIIRVDTKLLEAGHLLKINFVKYPVYIYKRTEEEINYLSSGDKSHLADPSGENLYSSIDYSYQSSSSYVWARMLLINQPEIENLPFRSLNKYIFVAGGWSPHSGCELQFNIPGIKEKIGLKFFDPCVGASFDVSGKIVTKKFDVKYHGCCAKYNMYIPPHKIVEEGIVEIGVPEDIKIPELPHSFKKSYIGLTPDERLMVATRFNDIDEVRSALNDGADASFYEIGKGSPFDAAIIGGSMQIIQLLIDNGAVPTDNSLNVANFVGRSDVEALILSIYKNNR